MAKRSRPRKTGSEEEVVGDGIEGAETLEEAGGEEMRSESGEVAKGELNPPTTDVAEIQETLAEKVEKEMKSWAEVTEEEQKKERSTYASVVEGKNSEAGWGLKYIEPQSKEGKVVITRAEFDAGSMNWNNTVVGYVIGRKPNFMEMKKFTQNQWRMELPKFSLLGNGVCLFTFNDEKQKMGILNRGWTFFGFPLVLKQWTPEMDLENVQVNRIPVWIRLPRLHLSLWNPIALGKIASAVGIPITTDTLTANKQRLDFARVLVEMEVRDELPEHISVEVDGETVYQEVEFEWKPQKCSKCSKYGHASAQCRVAPQAIWVEKKQQKENIEEKDEKAEESSSTEVSRVKTKPAEKNDKRTENVKKGVQKKNIPPKPTILVRTPGSKGKGVEESSKQGKSVITLKSPGVVLVQLGMDSTQKEGGTNEFDNQGMQIAGGGKTKSKRR